MVCLHIATKMKWNEIDMSEFRKMERRFKDRYKKGGIEVQTKQPYCHIWRGAKRGGLRGCGGEYGSMCATIYLKPEDMAPDIAKPKPKYIHLNAHQVSFVLFHGYVLPPSPPPNLTAFFIALN